MILPAIESSHALSPPLARRCAGPWAADSRGGGAGLWPGESAGIGGGGLLVNDPLARSHAEQDAVRPNENDAQARRRVRKWRNVPGAIDVSRVHRQEKYIIAYYISRHDVTLR